jgi:hypothetical protein
MKVKLEDDVVLTVYKPERYQDPTGVVKHQSEIDQEHDEQSERDGVFFPMFEERSTYDNILADGGADVSECRQEPQDDLVAPVHHHME